MSVREIFRECGLQDYIKLLHTDLARPELSSRHKAAADWGPSTAFPSRLLQDWLLSRAPAHSTQYDDLSKRLPIEVIECIFAYLERGELYHLTYMNCSLSIMALARLYHDPCLDANIDLLRAVGCLNTLSNKPRLSAQVYTFEFVWTPKGTDETASFVHTLDQVLTSISPHAHSIYIKGGLNTPDALFSSLNCPKLRVLRLEGSSGLRPINTPGIIATSMTHLEAHVGFVSVVLGYLPRLSFLVVVANDTTLYPHETEQLYNLQHPMLQKLSVILTWSPHVDPIWVRRLSENMTGLAKLSQVKHLTFVLSVPIWGLLPNFVFYTFLHKLPQLRAILLDSAGMPPQNMLVITSICPYLTVIVLQMEDKEWIKDHALARWNLFNRTALANALYSSKFLTTLDELRMALANCIEQGVDVGTA